MLSFPQWWQTPSVCRHGWGGLPATRLPSVKACQGRSRLRWRSRRQIRSGIWLFLWSRDVLQETKKCIKFRVSFVNVRKERNDNYRNTVTENPWFLVLHEYTHFSICNYLVSSIQALWVSRWPFARYVLFSSKPMFYDFLFTWVEINEQTNKQNKI